MNAPVFILPEAYLAATALLLLIFGAMRGDRSTAVVSALAVVGLLVTGVMVAMGPESGLAFHDMFRIDAFSRFVKLALLSASALSVLLAGAYLAKTKIARPEYPVLILFATVGMMLMVSANDLMALYVGLELQSLALYVLAAFRRDHAKSSEAGLKYFVLGALSSGMLLYGISLFYGYAGTTNFETLGMILTGGAKPALGVVFGLVFICAALAFKVSAVPFHMWTPDVYEGAPTPVTAFFAAAPKLAALALFTRVLMQPLGGLEAQWAQIIVFVAVASMLLGSFAGLAQGNIKRLMAYSSIANVGFILVGLLAGEAGIQAMLIYLVLYFVNILGVFSVVLCLRRQGRMVEKISDLAALSKSHPMLALAMVFFMFSLAGVPPLAGFFGKYFVFLAAVKAGMVPLAVIGVLTSCVAAYYYLRVIKVMYFDESTEGVIDPVPEYSLRVVTALTACAVLLFVINPAPLVDSALVAAHSLLRG